MEDASYVSVLEQYLKSVDLNSTYQVVPEDDNARRRSVSYQLTVNDYTVTGVGKTKKKAKENAAEQMYNLLIAEEKKRAQTDSEDDIQDPVEALIDLCTQLSLETPKFECDSKVVSSHSTIYNVSCTIGGIREEMKSFKKDRAKKQLANSLFLKIKSQEKMYVDYSMLKEEEMLKTNCFRLPDGSINFGAQNQLVVNVRNQQFAEFLKKSNTAYEMKMKPESHIDELQDPEGLFQRIMKEMEVDYKFYFHFEQQEWICFIEMYPINFKMKMKHKIKSKAGKSAIINTLKFIN
nr:uncharacterized protein LOC106680962 [Halyomorpha halys]